MWSPSISKVGFASGDVIGRTNKSFVRKILFILEKQRDSAKGGSFFFQFKTNRNEICICMLINILKRFLYYPINMDLGFIGKVLVVMTWCAAFVAPIIVIALY